MTQDRSDRIESPDILLIEDNEGDIYLAEEALKEGDGNVDLHVVRDGVEALAFLRRQHGYEDAPRPDLILLDLNMPRLGGREVLTLLKESNNLRSIPVVVLSTSSASEDILQSYQLCANCYFTKPSDPNDYMAMIQNIEQFWLRQVNLPPAEWRYDGYTVSEPNS